MREQPTDRNEMDAKENVRVGSFEELLKLPSRPGQRLRVLSKEEAEKLLGRK